MILQSLRELALREVLVGDSAFESKPVRWIIDLDEDGSFSGVLDTNLQPPTPEGKKTKPRPEAKMMVIPRRGGRTVNIAPDFLVDNAKYALGLMADEGIADEKTAVRHAAFIQLLQHAGTENRQIKAVLSFLEDTTRMTECANKLARSGGFASNDLFTFRVDGELLHEAEDLCAWWIEHLAGSTSPSTGQQCLICGEARPLAGNHALIQIPGAVTNGVPLVTFNANAFEKYGWSGNDNAPVCNECMTAYTEGLRRLTRPRYVIPGTGQTVGPLRTSLTSDTIAIYWADAASDFVACLPMLRDNPKEVEKLLASPHAGKERALRQAERFFCLILTGAQGRAIVRKLHTGTVAVVQANLRLYFAAIDVERYDRSAPMPLFRLLQSLVLKGELDRLPAELGTELWMASLFAEPLSRRFLTAVVSRNCAEQKVTAERAALLQFYFACRTKRNAPTPQPPAILEETSCSMSLDRENKNRSYLLGRLLGVLENLQTAAQTQGINRTVVDRFFGAASTRPAVVFPQLLQLALHHKAKSARSSPGRTINLDKEIGAILNGLNPAEGFGATLSLEEQGRFAIGYYHQRQSYYRPTNRSESQADADSTGKLHPEETTA